MKYIDVVVNRSIKLQLEEWLPGSSWDQHVIAQLTDRGKDVYDPNNFDEHLLYGRTSFKKVFHADMFKLSSFKKHKLEERTQVAVKLVRGPHNVATLFNEAKFYVQHLNYLMGEAVPRFHGLFRTTVSGLQTACMILEWCGEQPVVFTEVLNRQKWEVILALHAEGIKIESTPAEDEPNKKHKDSFDQHFVYAHNRRPMVVGFSKACHHLCRDFNPEKARGAPVECGELCRAQAMYGRKWTGGLDERRD